ncbi:hypothetical protein [Hydrogenophaga sp. PAMC20947]|uniref:hypothetical protein n=1 Tax=Hydrogenophaga sp. PAMC20947 TaxID=2565558 RepID=UPI001B34CD1A|nr:hypothetical protein [Hydrogenophaga sp. PAMC20947]
MTRSVRPIELPAGALLQRCRDAGAYADCYTCEVDGSVSHVGFVEAFYTTRLFKVERFILRWLARRPATDADARRLAEGTADSFSAWRVEGRAANQLLLADFTGHTKSWLMVAPGSASGAQTLTRLYFGSAVVPQAKRGPNGEPRMGFVFPALLGFHRLYSRLLLGAARASLMRAQLARTL